MEYTIVRIDVRHEPFDIDFFFAETGDEPFSIQEFGAGTPTYQHLARIYDLLDPTFEVGKTDV